MAFLQDPINQPDLGGEAGSSKHLRQHSRHCSKQTCRHAKCFSKIVLPAPGPAVGGHHNCTETQLCKNTKNRTRHLEDASHQLLQQPLRENSTSLFLFPIHYFPFLRTATNPNLTCALTNKALTTRPSPSHRTELLPARPHPAAPCRTISLNPR